MRKRNHRKKKANSEYVFSSYFEERKTYEYLINLINSRLAPEQPEKLCYFAIEVLGKKRIIPILKESKKIDAEKDNYDDWIRSESLSDNLTNSALIRLLKEDILPLLVHKLKSLGNNRDAELEQRLESMKKTFKLTDIEVEIISFYYLLTVSDILEKYLNSSSNFADFMVFQRFRSYGHILLGCNQKAFWSVISQKKLTHFGLMDMTGRYDNNVEINGWCIKYLLGVGEDDFNSEFFTKETAAALRISDFNVPENESLVLDDLFKRKGSSNILFYGPPGTGKSSLAKALAKEYGKEIYSVMTPKDDDHTDRLRAVHATINLSDKNTTIILIDEADELLNTYNSMFFRSKTNKSWINNILEGHDRKIIWITNRTDEIDQSTMRRFSFSREFKSFTAENRKKVLEHELKKKSLTGYFTEEEVRELCRDYSVDAGGIVNAISIFTINKKQKKATVLRKIRTVLKNHEKAIGAKKAGPDNKKEFRHYSLTGLNPSHNLEEIISIADKYAVLQGKEGVKSSLSMLLYGLPGTGKTEFAHYLGHILKKEVILKRCSEMQSCWVGETEKNIARAFQEAQENNTILFFDEADSFLFPRSSAQRSWEITGTNEILAQLDIFAGIVIFATNDMPGLDHAALRRFKFKVEFRPLTPEGNLQFYSSVLGPLVLNGPCLTDDEISRIKGISNLSPGDFAVVKDQFQFVASEAITHEKLMTALMNEARLKKGTKELGFKCGF